MSYEELLLKEDYTLNKDWPLISEQNEGVRFLLEKFNAVLAYQTGLGKTYTALTAAQHLIEFRKDLICVIVCPKSANGIFKKEIETKLKKAYSINTADEYKQNKNSRYFIFNSTKLSLLKDFLKRLKPEYKVIAIIDEAHWLQTATTNQSKQMLDLRSRFSCVFALTATPILNHIEGLFNVINYIRPGFFPTWGGFSSSYLVTKRRTVKRGNRMMQFDEIIGYKNTEFLSKLLQKVVIVKRKTYNLDFFYYKSVMTELETQNYKIASEGVLSALKGKEAKIKDWGARLHDLQRVVDGSHELTKSSSANNKEKLLVKCIRDVLDKNESALIYTEYETTYERLSKLFAAVQKKNILDIDEVFMITGKVPYKERIKVEKNLSGRSVVIMTRAGSQSINLKQANNVIFYDIPFSVGVFIQVLGRITRMDSTYDRQNIYLLEVEGTIDTYKRMLIQDHADLIKKLFGVESNLPEVKKIDRVFMNALRRKLLWNYKKEGK